ncbi:MAG: ComEC/Rec2 family competence protein [Patescibacteria group bacterium]
MSISKIVFKKIFLGIFLGITVFVWYGVLAEERNGLLTIAFLDVGQGDAIFIESPSGKQILLDGGPNGKVLRELSQLMPFYDRTINILIASHPDADHIGGFPEVFKNYEIGEYFNSGVLCDTALCEVLDENIRDEEIEKKILTRGQVIDLGDGAYLEILFPDRDATNFETNLASLVIKLVYGKNSFLLMGDSPKSIEDYLSRLDGNPPAGGLDVDVLKLGHHGSKTSSGEYFLGLTSPELAIISVGADNRYGHPSQEVLDSLNNLEIKTLRTDEQGTLIIQSDGKNLIY